MFLAAKDGYIHTTDPEDGSENYILIPPTVPTVIKIMTYRAFKSAQIEAIQAQAQASRGGRVIS